MSLTTNKQPLFQYFIFLPNAIIFQMKLLFLQTFAPLVFFLVITNQSCLHNQYYDTISSQCIDCQSGCDQCSNSSNNCTACIPNFYLANGSCLPCPKACYSCSNPSNCTNCKSNFYLSNNSCLNCSQNCMICTADSCRICQAGYNISTNCSTCVRQFFFNSSTNSCQICVLGCLDCTSTSNCSSCSKNYKLVNYYCQYLGNSESGSNLDSGESNQTQSSNKNIFFIILGILCGAAVASIIGCFLYYWCTRKHKKVNNPNSQQTKLVSKASKTIFHMDKEIVLDHQNVSCMICKLDNAQIQSSCGHFFHKKCFEEKQRKCLICVEDVSVAETFFNESNNKIQGKRQSQSIKQQHDQELNAKKQKEQMIEMESLE